MSPTIEELTNPAQITKNMFIIAFNDDFVFNTWLPALRSGKYLQGIGRLRTNDDKYCCLGVGCDVWNNALWTLNENPFGDRWYYQKESGASIPFANFVGLREDAGEFYIKDEDGYTTDSCLAALNDEGYTFAQIADIIECHAKAAMKERGRS